MPAFAEFPLSDAVRATGDTLRYHVQSRTNRRMEYLVDLAECGFNGACSCPQFQIRHLSQLRRDRRELPAGKRPKRRCWHIQKALEFHAELSARILMKRLPKTK